MRNFKSVRALLVNDPAKKNDEKEMKNDIKY